MLLQEALKLLQEGEVMCREFWTQEDGYLALMSGMKHVWKIVLQPTPNAGNYIFSLDDLLADDWKKFSLDDLLEDDWKKFEMPKEAVEMEIQE